MLLRSHVHVPLRKVTVLCVFVLLTMTVLYCSSALFFLCLPDLLLTDKSQGSLCAPMSVKASMINMNLVQLSPVLRDHHKDSDRATDNNKPSQKQRDTTKHKLQYAKTERRFIKRATSFEIVNMAKTVTSVNKGPLLLTIVNEAYLPLTFNWLCHTAKLPGVHEKLIFLVQGKETEKRLNQRWPNIKTHTVNQTQNEPSGPLKFGTVGYIRMMVRRTELLNALVQANISFLLFETDFIWFENPVPDFIKMGQEENLDLVGTVSTADTQNMCGAFIYFRNTTRMRTLWAEVTRQIHGLEDQVRTKNDKDPAPYRQNEQVYLNRLLEANNTGARYGVVDYEIVVDGKWYKMKAAQRKQFRPKAIHNNFLHNAVEKLHRFRRFGHWVLDSNLRCNTTTVDRLLRRRK